MIDSGSTVNIIDEPTYTMLNPPPTLKRDNVHIKAYGSDKSLPIKGSFTSDIESATHISCAKFYVVPGPGGSLLGYKTAEDLGLLTIACTNCILDTNTRQLVSEYQDIFDGIGKLKDVQVRLHIDTSVVPVKQPHRHIPFHMRSQVDAELDNLECQDIIEKVSGPTPWVSPIVASPKPKNPSQIRICIDV